jgi:hypothetical protein
VDEGASGMGGCFRLRKDSNELVAGTKEFLHTCFSVPERTGPQRLLTLSETDQYKPDRKGLLGKKGIRSLAPNKICFCVSKALFFRSHPETSGVKEV